MVADNKPFSSEEERRRSMTHSILLELDQSDHLFDKKKKLLKMKGFGSKEHVCLKDSLCPDGISTTLKRLVQIERIMQLNEAEIYFAYDDVSSPDEFYSPRNEIEALNSILSFVGTSLSSNMCTQLNVLQKLREVVFDMIRDFGDKNSVKTAIVEDYCCAKENCLLQWGESNGVRTSLQIAYVEGAGRGTRAKEDLNVGDTALEIPLSIIISEELIQNSNMYPILEKIEGISSETKLLFWSMKERHNPNSRFKLYFDTLPEAFFTGLSFQVDALVALYGTLLLEEITQIKEHLVSQYNEFFPALSNDYPDIFPPELFTWEQFLWGCELWYSNGMKIMFPDGNLRTCLIPIAGFLNHSLCPHILHYGIVDSATNSLKFCLSRPCHAGEQCYLSYGNLSSSHLLTFYGFLPKGDNPYDVIPMEIDTGLDDSSDGTFTSNWASHMVRGTWLSNNHNIFHYGLPSPLLDHLRNARNPMMLRMKTLLQGNLENEMEVLNDLLETFGAMMENLGDSAEFGDDTSWDVKLAVQFRDIQTRIVSSVLASCSSGQAKVKDELLKCMAEDTRG